MRVGGRSRPAESGCCYSRTQSSSGSRVSRDGGKGVGVLDFSAAASPHPLLSFSPSDPMIQCLISSPHPQVSSPHCVGCSGDAGVVAPHELCVCVSDDDVLPFISLPVVADDDALVCFSVDSIDGQTVTAGRQSDHGMAEMRSGAASAYP